MLRTPDARAAYAVLQASRGHLNPFTVQAHCAGWAGKTHAGPGLGLQHFLETLQGAESFAFLRKKIGLGYYICVCKTFPHIAFILGTRKYSR